MSAGVSEQGLRAGHLALEDMYNLRDVGGYPTDDGGITRPGLLFRSDSPHALRDGGQLAVSRLGLRTVIDLREPSERLSFPTRLGGVGARIVELPLVGKSGADRPGGAGWTLQHAYLAMVRHRGPQLARTVTILCEDEALPALVHCMAGKDRTGVVIAVTLCAVGVDETAVVADFAGSGLFLDERYRREALGRVAAHGLDPLTAQALLGSDGAHMQGTLDELRQGHGGAAEYLMTHGVKPDRLKRLCERLVEHPKARRAV